MLLCCLGDAGGPAEAIEHMRDDRIKALLKAKSEEALSKGVFGSPFFIWRDEPFWGADRIDMLINWVNANSGAATVA